MRKGILLFGNREAIYHPVTGFGERLADLLPEYAVTVTEEEEQLSRLDEFDLCVMYREFEEPPLGDEAAAGLLMYPAAGGPLLVIHNGISIQSRGDLAQLVGGAFTGHPPYEELPVVHYKIDDREHPIMKGVEDFDAPDELYRFTRANLADCHLLLSYEDEGRRYPAGWVRTYGRGTVVYLCCGHNAGIFDAPDFCRMIKNTADWLTEERS